jgi:hypothetical protein
LASGTSYRHELQAAIRCWKISRCIQPSFTFFADFSRNLSGRRRYFVFRLVVAIPRPARTEEFRSSKFGTRWYVNAAAAPLLQRFENYYGASH